MFEQRVSEPVSGLLGGGCLGAGVGAIGLAVVGVLITGEPFLIILAGGVGAFLGGIYGAVYGTLHGAIVGVRRRPLGGPEANRLKLVGRMIVIHLISLVALAMLVAYLWSVQTVNLPAPSDVQSMAVSFFERTGKPGSFAVPSKHIPTVLAALSPATRDWSPYKWEVLHLHITCKDGRKKTVDCCRLEIACKDGKKMTVDLYRTYHAIGAFSVHLDDRPWNSGLISHYFRGGTDQAIENAIKTACESSKSE
jgi:hypothetical protein